MCILSQLAAVLAFCGCGGGEGTVRTEPYGTEETDTCSGDTVSSWVEEEMEEEDERLDGSFDDFLFAFTTSRRFFYERVRYPVMLRTEDGGESRLSSRNLHREFAFLEGDYYTVLYGDTCQIEPERDDSLAVVERIDLDSREVRRFDFRRLEGRWMLTGISDGGLYDTGLGPFLEFYARFSSDSLFQSRSIAQPLAVSIIDPEDDGQCIEGTIDAEQWTSFCPDVPSGVISNIRCGQEYGGGQVVMEKCGAANGMRELFTFRHEGTGWKLTAYEN